jgi:hypothetical protein
MNRLFIGILGAIALCSTIERAQALPFSPPADNTAPRSAAGGASRNTFFNPPSDNSAPRRAAGGASRGTFFTPPADNPAPRRAVGAATRGEGAAGTANSAMKGLMPQSYYGTTVLERPAILVYLADSEAEEVMFSLKDEASNLQYSFIVPVTGAGVYAFQLPMDAPVLEEGKNYQWFAALKSRDGLTPSSPYVEGWIKRVAASTHLAESLTQDDDLAKVMALGAEGVWYDSVAKLAFLRDAQPQSETIASHWTELLTSVGLEDISTAPLVGVAPQR